VSDADDLLILSQGAIRDLRNPAVVTSSERVFEGRVWDIRRDEFTFGGHTIAREYVDHPGAVAVLAIDDQDRVLLINQYRHPIGLRDWELPAGLLDVEGEPPLDELFLCLVSNVSPWTYLGARPVNPSPQASFDTGLDVFAMGRMGPLRMLRTLRQTMARRPDARGAGVHRIHDLPEVTVSASRPQGWQLDGDHLGTATGLRLHNVRAALRVIA